VTTTACILLQCVLQQYTSVLLLWLRQRVYYYSVYCSSM